MIRTCNEDDWTGTGMRWILEERGLAPCGKTYDDVDHSTICPHARQPRHLRRRGPVSARRCPTPWKQRHDSQGAARRHLEDLRHHVPNAAEGKHTYKCACGKWHVGDPRKRRPKNRKLKKRARHGRD